jgi:hypothetical protein
MDPLSFAKKHGIRVTSVNGEYVFCAPDLGRVLGWKSPPTRQIPSHHKMLAAVETPGGVQSLTHLTCDGLKRILCRSRSVNSTALAKELGLSVLEYRMVRAEEESVRCLVEAFAGEKMTPQKQVHEVFG